MSQDHLRMKITHGFIGPRNAQIFSLNNAQILIWPPDYYAKMDLLNILKNVWCLNLGAPWWEWHSQMLWCCHATLPFSDLKGTSIYKNIFRADHKRSEKWPIIGEHVTHLYQIFPQVKTLWLHQNSSTFIKVWSMLIDVNHNVLIIDVSPPSDIKWFWVTLMNVCVRSMNLKCLQWHTSIKSGKRETEWTK